MKITIPNIDSLNIHNVYHWILEVHSISCIVKTCSCLVTATISLNYIKARLVTRDIYLACLHTMNRHSEVATNKIMTVANRKMSIV